MRSIFVECLIRAPIERVWELTQRPELHQRWDLRFSSIQYLAEDSQASAQRFLYQTKIGFGLAIAGEGESVGEKEGTDGRRTSALKFWSDDPRALILEGSGFWQYEPHAKGTLFRTRYDYRTRYGFFGRSADVVFRPLIGWATAWSFDALRLWAERDIQPELSMLRLKVYALARGMLVFAWIYQGLVPKLLFPRFDERISRASGFDAETAMKITTTAGVVECSFGLLLLLLWRKRWLLQWQIPILLLLPMGLIFNRPSVLTEAFNPVTLNLSMIVLAALALLASKDLPSARNCKREQAE
ncbi:MAG: DoxX-like family protein [Fimbriimonas sp.]